MDYEAIEEDNDDIINIRVSSGDNRYSNNDYEEAEENYQSLGKNRQVNQYNKWYAGNLNGGQDTIRGLSDIKGDTINESEVNMAPMSGTISSLVELMNDVRQGFGKEMYLLERENMFKSDPLRTKQNFKEHTYIEEKNHAPQYHPSHYSSGNQTAYFNSEADLRNKYINNTHSRQSLEEDKRTKTENQMASKVNIGIEENIEDPDLQSYDSPLKNYNTELFQIQEEMPYSSTSMISDKRTEPNRGHRKKDSAPTSTYYSLASHSDNLNETFLLCFLMTPRLLRLYTDEGICLPYMFRLSPGPRMLKMFVEHYIFEFLEPESLTQVGTIDLLEVADVLSDEKFRRICDQDSKNMQNKSIFFIEVDSNME